jgi:hypothetical protein
VDGSGGVAILGGDAAAVCRLRRIRASGRRDRGFPYGRETQLQGVWGQTPDCGRFFLARWPAGVKNLNRAFS